MVAVTLQEPNGDSFRDVKSLATDGTGKFDFGKVAAGKYRMVFSGPRGFCHVTVPSKLSEKGWGGFKLVLPVAASDSCPEDCDERVKIDEAEL